MVGLTINVTLAISYAQSSWWHATIMALEGVAIEVLAFRSPSWGSELWRGGSKVASAAAWGIWPVMIVMSLMAATGFSASTIGDVLAQRSVAVTKASAAAIKTSNAASDLQQWRDERKEITERRTAKDIEIQLVRDRRKVDKLDRDAFEATLGCRRLTPDTMKACDPVLPTLQALEKAKRRDELDGKISEAESKQDGGSKLQDGARIIGSIDPGAESFSKIIGWISFG